MYYKLYIKTIKSENIASIMSFFLFSYILHYAAKKYVCRNLSHKNEENDWVKIAIAAR